MPSMDMAMVTAMAILMAMTLWPNGYGPMANAMATKNDWKMYVESKSNIKQIWCHLAYQANSHHERHLAHLYIHLDNKYFC
jgi:hypothetical protein